MAHLATTKYHHDYYHLQRLASLSGCRGRRKLAPSSSLQLASSPGSSPPPGSFPLSACRKELGYEATSQSKTRVRLVRKNMSWFSTSVLSLILRSPIIFHSYPFHSGSTLVRLHQSSFTQDARQRSVASRWERTCTASSGGRVVRSGKLSSWRALSFSLFRQCRQDTCPILKWSSHPEKLLIERSIIICCLGEL